MFLKKRVSEVSNPNRVSKGVAERAKKVIDFYKKKGGEVISPLVKALD